MINLPIRITLSSNVLFQPLGEEAVILNLENEQYYALDEVGTRLWQLFDECAEPETIIDMMAAEYAVDKATLRRDLAKFIDELLLAGLISVEQ